MAFLRNVLPVAGAAIGGVFGGPVGAGLGMTAGGMLGGMVDPATGDVVPTPVPEVSAGVSAMSPEQSSFLEALRRKYEAGTNLPSVAQAQLKESTDETVGQMSGALASIRGNQNPGLVGRNIINQAGMIRQKAGGQAATLRAQEAIDQEKMKMLQESKLLEAYEANRAAGLERERIKAGLSSTAMKADADQRAAAMKADSDYMGNIGTAGTALATSGMKSGNKWDFGSQTPETRMTWNPEDEYSR